MRRLITLVAFTVCAGGAVQPLYAQAKNAPPITRDSDRDGVPDLRDRCRGTPPGTRVDATGCPLPAAPQVAAVPAGPQPGAAPAPAAPQQQQPPAVQTQTQPSRPPDSTALRAGQPVRPAPAQVAAAQPAAAQPGPKAGGAPPAGLPLPAGVTPTLPGARPAGAATNPPAGAAAQQPAGQQAPPQGAQPQVSVPQVPPPVAAAPAGAAQQAAQPPTQPAAPLARPAGQAAAPVTHPPAAANPAAAAADPNLTAGYAVAPFSGTGDAAVLAYAGELVTKFDTLALRFRDVFVNASGAPVGGATSPSFLSSRERNRWMQCRRFHFDIGSYAGATADLRERMPAHAALQRALETFDDALQGVLATAECDNIVSMIEAPDRFTPWQQSYEESARNFYQTWYGQVRAAHEAARAFARALAQAGQNVGLIPGLPATPPHPVVSRP
jgi:hypothetical protein